MLHIQYNLQTMFIWPLGVSAINASWVPHSKKFQILSNKVCWSTGLKYTLALSFVKFC